MIAIVDYGVGNLFSLTCSLEYLMIPTVVTSDSNVLAAADGIILPGVGAFGDAITKLEHTGLAQTVKDLATAGKPILGICLGMQLLFEKSYEFGEYNGLGLIPGEIRSLKKALVSLDSDLKVPQIGWNQIQLRQTSPLLKYVPETSWFYYVHSFYGTNCDPNLVASSDYGVAVPGIVQNGNVYGVQFHPEKSGEAGLALLKSFAEVTENGNFSSN